MTEPEVKRVAPGFSGEESAAAKAMREAMERRKGAAMAQKSGGAALTEQEKKDKKAAYMREYWRKRKAKQSVDGPKQPGRKKAKRAASHAVVHVPKALPPAPIAQFVGAPPSSDALTIIKEGHRLMDRLERFFGKPE